MLQSLKRLVGGGGGGGGKSNKRLGLFLLILAALLFTFYRFMHLRGGGLALPQHVESHSAITTTAAATSSYGITTSYQTTEFDIDPSDTKTKYFVYQPSGGWGNQRLILRWAMRAANAMERTLIVPNIAPHNMMWYGYDRINASDSMHADQVLEMKALEVGLTHGVRVYRGHLRDLATLLPGTWRRQSLPSPYWLTANAIRSKWKNTPERVVFWRKGSMWECCSGGMEMTKYIVFSKQLRELSLLLARNLFKGGAPYHSAHVRRGGGHTRIERRTAQHFIDLRLKPKHMLDGLPLYIATDEKNLSWFDPLREHVKVIYFWPDVVAASPREVGEYLGSIPQAMRNDAIGFLEQLICARAEKFADSDGSTFSFAISGMRAYPNSLTTSKNVDWKIATETKSAIDGLFEPDEESAPRTAESEQADND